jgi:hypothetical protein
MKCSHCRQEFYHGGIMISIDGDFVCSERCKREWQTERDWMLNTVVPDEKRCEAYMLGTLNYPD